MKPYYFVRRAESPDPKHETLEAAQAKAERMAEGEPGQAFEILRCVGCASTSKASTVWMDGEEPPEQKRYRDLVEGDVFQEGDEWKEPFGKWKPRKYGFGEPLLPSHYPHRRPL